MTGPAGELRRVVSNTELNARANDLYCRYAVVDQPTGFSPSSRIEIFLPHVLLSVVQELHIAFAFLLHQFAHEQRGCARCLGL